jgi:hypothetical protein
MTSIIYPVLICLLIASFEVIFLEKVVFDMRLRFQLFSIAVVARKVSFVIIIWYNWCLRCFICASLEIGSEDWCVLQRTTNTSTRFANSSYLQYSVCMCLYVCFCLSPSLCLCLYLSLSLCPSVSLSVSLCLSLSLSVSLCLSLCLSLSQCVSLSVSHARVVICFVWCVGDVSCDCLTKC